MYVLSVICHTNDKYRYTITRNATTPTLSDCSGSDPIFTMCKGQQDGTWAFRSLTFGEPMFISNRVVVQPDITPNYLYIPGNRDPECDFILTPDLSPSGWTEPKTCTLKSKKFPDCYVFGTAQHLDEMVFGLIFPFPHHNVVESRYLRTDGQNQNQWEIHPWYYDQVADFSTLVPI